MRVSPLTGPHSRAGDPTSPGDVRDERYTVLLVPEGGRGRVRQVDVPLRWVRAGVAGGATALALLVGAAWTGAAVFPRIENHDALVAENLALRARLESAEGEIRDVAMLVQRVRVYDDRLRELSQKDRLPGGFGPMDAEEQRAREAWIRGVVGETPRTTETDVALRAAQLETLAMRVADDLAQVEGRLDGLHDVLVDMTGTAYPVTPPLDALVHSSAYGWRQSPFGQGWKFHAGLDLEGDRGDPVYAVQRGLVVFSGWYGGYGYVIDIDHGDGVVTRYGHNSQLLAPAGEMVEAGDLIAQVGSTGWSTGPHLHFELRVDGESVDPSPYFANFP